MWMPEGQGAAGRKDVVFTGNPEWHRTPRQLIAPQLMICEFKKLLDEFELRNVARCAKSSAKHTYRALARGQSGSGSGGARRYRSTGKAGAGELRWALSSV